MKKNIMILLTVLMPIVYVVGITILVIGIDKNLVQERLTINYHASERYGGISQWSSAGTKNITFISNEYSDIIFERKYKFGLLNIGRLLPDDLKPQKLRVEELSDSDKIKTLEGRRPNFVYIYLNKMRIEERIEKLKTGKKISFFSFSSNFMPYYYISSSEIKSKNFYYYYDIFRYVRNKYIIFIIAYVLGYAFIIGNAMQLFLKENNKEGFGYYFLLAMFIIAIIWLFSLIIL